MRAIASARANALALGWLAFAVANVAAMVRWPDWETIPFHFIWVSLTLLYGFIVWGLLRTYLVLGAVAATTGCLIAGDALQSSQPWGELFEVPLMSAMFLAMVWHARRRQEALRAAEHESDERMALLARQERFQHDVSHELRTPVTIARGHLEVFRRTGGRDMREIAVALDELERIDGILERLLVLAQAERPDFVAAEPLELETFLEDVFMRWSEVAPRSWRLGQHPAGTLLADAEALRTAVDALLENAVKYTGEGDAIELRAETQGTEVAIEVADEGRGVPVEALDRIFQRFGRADAARTRTAGGVGLGLAIVDAIARAHGGRCTVVTSSSGSVFALHLPGFSARAGETPAALASPGDDRLHDHDPAFAHSDLVP
jgi:signal transduction histidine kinase